MPHLRRVDGDAARAGVHGDAREESHADDAEVGQQAVRHTAEPHDGCARGLGGHHLEHATVDGDARGVAQIEDRVSESYGVIGEHPRLKVLEPDVVAAVDDESGVRSLQSGVAHEADRDRLFGGAGGGDGYPLVVEVAADLDGMARGGPGHGGANGAERRRRSARAGVGAGFGRVVDVANAVVGGGGVGDGQDSGGECRCRGRGKERFAHVRPIAGGDERPRSIEIETIDDLTIWFDGCLSSSDSRAERSVTYLPHGGDVPASMRH